MLSLQEVINIPFVKELLDKSYDEGGLDCYELTIYTHALRTQDEPTALFSVERLCAKYKMGKMVCRRAIKSLEARGLLIREFYHDEKGYKRAFYRVICQGENPFETLLFDDEDCIVVSQFTKSPLELLAKKGEVKTDDTPIKAQNQAIKQEIEQVNTEALPSENKANTGHIKQEVKTYNDLMAEQVEEKAMLIYKKFCKNDSLDYENWLEWAKYKQAVGNINIASLEIILKQNMNIINTFGDKANEAIEKSINAGYKSLFLPQDKPQQQGKVNANGNASEVKENSITKAGINIPIKWDLLVPSVYYDLDYSKEFWSIVKCYKADDLSKYLIIDGRDKEVREFLNECIELRLAFLAKVDKARAEINKRNENENNIWGNL